MPPKAKAAPREGLPLWRPQTGGRSYGGEKIASPQAGTTVVKTAKAAKSSVAKTVTAKNTGHPIRLPKPSAPAAAKTPPPPATFAQSAKMFSRGADAVNNAVPGRSAPPLIPVAILVAGAYIAWFAVHYWRDTTQAYPSGPVKSILTGKGLPKPVREGSAADPNASGFTGLTQTVAAAAQSVNQGSVTGSAGSEPSLNSAKSAEEGAAAANGKTQFSETEIEQLWVACGGDPAKAQYAGGVAMAESSGDTLSQSSNPDGGTNWGLWQLDTKGVGAGHPVADLTDPVKSTQITIMATRNGTDWADWADSYTAIHGTQGIV